MARQPRVMLVFDTFPPHRDGGAGFVHNLSRQLLDLGAEVHVLTSTTARPFDPRTMGEGFHLWPIVTRWSWDWRDTSAISLLRRTLRGIRPDVVHVVYPSSERPNSYHLPVLLKLFARCPVVTTFFSLSLLRGVTVRTRLTGMWLVLTSDILVSHDPFYLSFLRFLSSWRLGRVRYVPVGANVRIPKVFYHPDRVAGYRAALGLSPSASYLAHFGNIDTSRDIDTLLEVVRRLREDGLDVRLIMMGGSRPTDEGAIAKQQRHFRHLVASLADSLGEAVMWTGFCSDEKVTQYFLASDCAVLPFHRNTFGRSSLAAALQHGMPIITTASGRSALFLRHGENAMLVPRDRPEALAAAVKQVLASPELRARLSQGARAAGTWYRWERVAAMSVRVYREAARRRGRDWFKGW